MVIVSMLLLSACVTTASKSPKDLNKVTKDKY